MTRAEEAEDVTIIPRGVFCALFLLFAVSTSPADQSAAPPLSQGEYLARAGDCVACHSVAGGKAFAGGLKMGSPLGNIYSTNITPDLETGIGTYSLCGFRSRRAQGRRQGRSSALSGHALCLLRQAIRRRRGGAL